MNITFVVMFVWSMLLTPFLSFVAYEFSKAFRIRTIWPECLLLVNAVVGALLCILFTVVIVQTMQIRFYASGVIAGAIAIVWYIVIFRMQRR